MADPKPYCPVCRWKDIPQPSDLGGGPHIKCPRCGDYGISDFLLNDSGQLRLSDKEREKLCRLLVERRLSKGQPLFLATADGGVVRGGKVVRSLNEFLETYPKTPLEYYDRALLNLSRLYNHPTQGVMFEGEVWPEIYFSDFNEADGMSASLTELGYTLSGHGRGVRITPKGWARVRELERPGRDAMQAFVAMWFDASQTLYYEEGFKPAIEADGRIKALRIDRKDHNNKIDDEIIAEIRRSRFVVADFNDHRGGVYFEAGFALGLGLPVIWTCHEDYIGKSHFDTRQYNHITYKTPEELREKLLNRIRATIL